MKVNNNLTNSVAFKHKIIIDIGASNPRGTLKIKAQSDDGRDIFKKNGYVNDNNNGFEDKNDFINKLHTQIKQVHEQIKNDKSVPLTKDDRENLSGIVMFVPGVTGNDGENSIIEFMPNLRDKNGNSLQNIKMKEYNEFLKTKKSGVSVNKDNFKLVATKDLGGAGLAIMKRLKNKNMLNVGDYIVGILTGGGFGSVDLKVRKNSVDVETCESSNHLTGNLNLKDELKNNSNTNIDEIKPYNKIGRLGTGVKDHIKVYFKEIGMPELAPLAIKAGDARIVNMNLMSVNKSINANLIDELDANPYFVKKSEDDDSVKFALNEELIDANKMKASRIKAINVYADAISLFLINKINDMANKVVLAGPFASGLNEYIKTNPEEFNATGLPDLINKKINMYIDENHANLPTTKKLKNLHNFEIFCDKDLNFKDNTFAGEILLDDSVEFTPNRGNWFNVPQKVI